MKKVVSKLVFFMSLGFLLITACSFSVLAAEEAEYGGTLNYPLPYPQSISTLEPGQSNDVTQSIVTKAIFSTLVRVDEASGKIVPDLAESYQVSQDGLNYIFNLRHGVTFHNGEAFTAEDVRFTFERILDPKQASVATPIAQNIAGAADYIAGKTDHLTGIKIIDDYTIKITLASLDVGFLDLIANEKAAILPEDYVTKVGNDFGMEPVGTGPFKFVELSQDEKVVVAAFKDYYAGRPYLDKIQFIVMPEAATRTASFRSDELDVDLVSAAQYKTYKNNPQYKDLLVEVPEVWVRTVIFNLDLEKFQDKRVRQAFNYAIDKKLIVEKLLNGKATAATGWLPPSNIAYNPELKGYEFNPEKAKELMQAAGYTPENPLEINIIGTNNPAWGIPVIEAAMPYLKNVGFKVTTEVVDGATWSTRARQGDFDAFIFSLGGETSPIKEMSLFFWSEIPRTATNYGNYKNEEFDRLIEKALNTVDLEQRIKYVQAAEKVLVDDAAAWFFNYNKAVMIRKPWVNGIVGNAREMTYQPFAKIWLNSSSPRK
ncbi:ABC transporter substrate-binding protein [Halanaerobium salsuginis]|uniref:Peptide/nickel transport system substrate-binding protein n=1 Tax=Halanaerobium salsuginis TaxID=29563 RepID=A0A1I4EJU0_9FIRM|nr:ABC transporter substrate-binding protein [Halanaerobium salsuginis]SFL05985.1 peptide/nickel transport system substrate-binding protein [Halanaerobium salsuginis]